jgi:proline iminopeptidase
VFLHGGPGEGSQAFQAYGGPQLERTQRLVYFDQRGAGKSDRPKAHAAYSIPIMVDDIEQLRRHLGAPKIVLLGHSFGTQLALEYAAKYPGHTAALVLAAAMPDLRRSLDLQCARLERNDPEAYARARGNLKDDSFPRCDTRSAYSGEAALNFVTRNLFPDRETARKVDALDNAGGAGNSGEAADALFSKGLLTYRFGSATTVSAPVLVIAGGKDYQAALEVQRDLVKTLPKAQMIVYPRDGHFLFVEEPARFARDVTAFMRREVR